MQGGPIQRGSSSRTAAVAASNAPSRRDEHDGAAGLTRQSVGVSSQPSKLGMGPLSAAACLFGSGHPAGIKLAAQAAHNALQCAVHLAKLQGSAQRQLRLDLVPASSSQRQALTLPLLDVVQPKAGETAGCKVTEDE